MARSALCRAPTRPPSGSHLRGRARLCEGAARPRGGSPARRVPVDGAPRPELENQASGGVPETLIWSTGLSPRIARVLDLRVGPTGRDNRRSYRPPVHHAKPLEPAPTGGLIPPSRRLAPVTGGLPPRLNPSGQQCPPCGSRSRGDVGVETYVECADVGDGTVRRGRRRGPPRIVSRWTIVASNGICRTFVAHSRRPSRTTRHGQRRTDARMLERPRSRVRGASPILGQPLLSSAARGLARAWPGRYCRLAPVDAWGRAWTLSGWGARCAASDRRFGRLRT